jgi:Uma2 family endonuclease
MNLDLRGDRPAPSDPPEPTWEIAHLFPAQGAWSEEEYLALNANRLIEFSHGHIEVLVMPSELHQLIVLWLYRALYQVVSAAGLGVVLVAPLRVRLWPGKYREPDIVFMLAEHAGRRHDAYWEGADLVMEVVSDEDRRRDVETKRFEYARAGIPEYWIVDPSQGRITVLRLSNERYVTYGEFSRGAQARSVQLSTFAVDVAEALSGREA